MVAVDVFSTQPECAATASIGSLGGSVSRVVIGARGSPRRARDT